MSALSAILISMGIALAAAWGVFMFVVAFRLSEIVNKWANEGRHWFDSTYKEWPGFMAYFVWIAFSLPLSAFAGIGLLMFIGGAAP